jgi:hypothetical protein
MKPLESYPNEWSLPENGGENTPSPSVNVRSTGEKRTVPNIVVDYDGSQESEGRPPDRDEDRRRCCDSPRGS